MAEIENTNSIDSQTTSKEVCGIIMPISDTEGYQTGHWNNVFNILYNAIDQAGFVGKMVSDSKYSNIIQTAIVQNIYENPIVICDVSSKNPNVMFELGLRLAFDKPTIVIKDDATDYNFDTSPIKHLNYPKDLRYNKIEEFNKDLVDALVDTYESFSSGHYQTFLQSFTKYKPTIKEEEIDLKDYVVKGFDTIQYEIQQLQTKAASKLGSLEIQENPVLMVKVKHKVRTGKSFNDYVKRIIEKKLTTFDRWNSTISSTGEMIINLRAPDHSLNELIKALQQDSDLSVTVAYF